jgi:hypothetical protein
MKKLNNYGVSFNFLFLVAFAILIASCGRQHGAVSFNNEKLKKQSLEIENTKPSSESAISSGKVSKQETTNNESNLNKEVLAKIEKAKEANEKLNSSETEPTVLHKKSNKLNPVQKAVLKKIERKLSPNDELATQRGGLDPYLKLAIILAIVAVILLIFPWPVSLLGWIALLVALVLFLLWAIENL